MKWFFRNDRLLLIYVVSVFVIIASGCAPAVFTAGSVTGSVAYDNWKDKYIIVCKGNLEYVFFSSVSVLEQHHYQIFDRVKNRDGSFSVGGKRNYTNEKITIKIEYVQNGKAHVQGARQGGLVKITVSGMRNHLPNTNTADVIAEQLRDTLKARCR